VFRKLDSVRFEGGTRGDQKHLYANGTKKMVIRKIMEKEEGDDEMIRRVFIQSPL